MTRAPPARSRSRRTAPTAACRHAAAPCRAAPDLVPAVAGRTRSRRDRSTTNDLHRGRARGTPALGLRSELLDHLVEVVEVLPIMAKVDTQIIPDRKLPEGLVLSGAREPLG